MINKFGKNKIIVLFAFVLTLSTTNVNSQGVGGLTEKSQNTNTSKFTHQTGKYLDIDGAKIYYEEIENKDKPVLLFLHGGLGNIEDFNSILNLFTNDYHIIGIDSRGHGKSTLGTNKLTYERLQFDVESVLNHLQMQDVTIIGFSDGGIVAYRLAASNKIRIQKLVTIGATWSLEDAELVEKLMGGTTLEEFRKIFAKKFEFYQTNNPQPDFNKFVKCLLEMWIDKTEAGYPYANITDINVPVLIVRGNDDDMFPLESAFELTKKIKNSLLLNIPFASHRAFREYPQIFETITKDFLRK
ncbi:MAG: alpha/beta hydrolase [Prevotellaceae bacterium]|jgi:pimeloyl-ACP methyl ester carboxylesterase|nr:alpha/beta hydrolase [Prevotellaceae bacterium]